MAGTRKQKETTKQSQVSARTKTTSKTTQKSAQTPKNKTTRTGARASEKRRETKPQYEEDTGFLQSEAVILGTFAVCVLLFLSNFHICGFLGDFFSRIMLGVFGCIGYLAPLLLFAELLFYASNKGNIRAVYKMIAVEVLLIVLCGLAQLVFGGGYREGQTILDIYKSAGVSGLGGGVIGGVLVMVLHTAVGTIGAYVVLLVFMIISLVCITEKSFVSAVKSGSGKAYRYAKEDYSRRKELHEERQEEKRRLREEQRVQGVDLAATDLSRTPDFGGIAGGYMGVVDAEAVSEADETKQEINVSDTYKEETADPKAETGSMQPDPADIFKGKITMGGRPVENPESSSEDQSKEGRFGEDAMKDVERVPFEEDAVPPGIHEDEDVFISHGESAFDDEDMFPDEKKRETKAWEKKPKVSVLSNLPDIPLDEPAADDDEIFASMRRNTERKADGLRAENAKSGKIAEPDETAETSKTAEEEKNEFPETEENEKTAGIPASEEESMSVLSDDEFLDTEPYVENEDYWIQAAEPGSRAYVAAHGSSEKSPERPAAKEPSEEHRQVVTASGKVIETDTEEIIKKKAEVRKREAAEREEAGNEVLKDCRGHNRRGGGTVYLPGRGCGSGCEQFCH